MYSYILHIHINSYTYELRPPKPQVAQQGQLDTLSAKGKAEEERLQSNSHRRPAGQLSEKCVPGSG